MLVGDELADGEEHEGQRQEEEQADEADVRAERCDADGKKFEIQTLRKAEKIDLQHDECEDEPDREVEAESAVELGGAGVCINNTGSGYEDGREGKPESTIR